MRAWDSLRELLARRPGRTRRRATRVAPGGWRPALEALRLALLAVGVTCVVWWTIDMTSANLARARAARHLDQMIAARAPGASPPEVSRPAKAVALGEPLGFITIPRIAVKTVVVEGDNDAELAFAAGHVPGTALPGVSGNVALAGHRDGVFSRLGRVRVGDLILLKTPAATYRYAVESTRIVPPTDVAVLDPVGRPTLTLITCFPFHYVGPAPKRFIVRADLL